MTMATEGRTVRASERMARQRAYAAAIEAIETRQSDTSLARKHDVAVDSVRHAVAALQFGTTAEIETLKSGDQSLSSLYEAIVARTPPEEIRRSKSAKMRRPRAEQFREVRMKALAAADAVVSENLSYEDAARRFGSNTKSVGDAYIVLVNSTPEELEKVRAGELGLRDAYVAIRLRGGVRSRKKAVLSVDFQEVAKIDTVIWARLRAALDAIRTLPSPQDVVAVARRNSRRREAVDASLLIAFNWMTEFSDAWTTK